MGGRFSYDIHGPPLVFERGGEDGGVGFFGLVNFIRLFWGGGWICSGILE